MAEPIVFLSGKQEKQGGLHYKETAPCPVQAGYGAASSYFEGNRELHAVKRMGLEAGLCPFSKRSRTYFKQEKIGQWVPLAFLLGRIHTMPSFSNG